MEEFVFFFVLFATCSDLFYKRPREAKTLRTSGSIVAVENLIKRMLLRRDSLESSLSLKRSGFMKHQWQHNYNLLLESLNIRAAGPVLQTVDWEPFACDHLLG